MAATTYRASSMREALELVRRELGPQAEVLGTRELRGGWLSRFFSHQVEVTASSPALPGNDFRRRPSSVADVGGEAAAAAALRPGRIPAAEEFDYRALFRARLRESHGGAGPELDDLADPCRTSSDTLRPRRDLQAIFAAAGIEASISRELIGRINDAERHSPVGHAFSLRRRAIAMIGAEIAVAGPLSISPQRQRVAALVGPTGVGKTTTIAKLAADFALRQQIRVGLVTVDTYRMAALEQLREYASILDVPLETAGSPPELKAAIERLPGCSLVLVDTAGRSPRDETAMIALEELLEQSPIDEALLVLSSAAGLSMQQNAAARFAAAGASSLIITKLDEAESLGELLALQRSCRLPLRYVTSGQEVPHDIAPAAAARLAELILGGPGSPTARSIDRTESGHA